MEVVVLAPFSVESPERKRNWNFLKPRYEWPVIECPDSVMGPWSKGRALEAGLERTTADVIVVADADVWCDELATAIERVEAGAKWAIAHDKVRRLTRKATREVLEGAEFSRHLELDEAAYTGTPAGGLVVFPRSTIEMVPLDPRFVGWGSEDIAWSRALRVLVGRPWRGRADLYHLWHPPPTRMSRTVGSEESRALLNRYRNARGPEAVREIIAEVSHGRERNDPEPASA